MSKAAAASALPQLDDARDILTRRVKQVSALSFMCRLAIEYGMPNETDLHNAVSAIADLALEASKALDALSGRPHRSTPHSAK